MKKLVILSLGILSGAALAVSAQESPYSMDFTKAKFEKKIVDYKGKKLEIRAYEHIVYVANPVDTSVQQMNVYIPEEYFKGKKINGYTAETAPIFFPNKIGGYMPAQPALLIDGAGPGRMFPGGQQPGGERPERPNGPDGPRPEGNTRPPMGPDMPAGMRPDQPSAILVALSKGYVVASAGARGRTSVDAHGNFTGKAPAAIVDLKAAIRYLRYNDVDMPGTADKIISNGTSAGGAMSALLGSTGNNSDYENYLTVLGAAPAKDYIFAVSAYCPITNLDHADMAYEWQFNGINEYRRNNMSRPGTVTPSQSNQLSIAQISLSNQLKDLFPEYINSLRLKDKNGNPLTLDKMGEGSFKEYVNSFLLLSAQKALDEGADMTKFSQVKVNADDKVTSVVWQAHVNYMGRMKTPPAFDGVDLSTAENQEFGDAKTDKKHFTTYSVEHSTVGKELADAKMVKMMNPMNYIGDKQTLPAKYWRIRHGANDKDTGFAVSVVLATYLQNQGYTVDFALPWDKPHSGDYDLDELFKWMDSICK